MKKLNALEVDFGTIEKKTKETSEKEDDLLKNFNESTTRTNTIDERLKKLELNSRLSSDLEVKLDTYVNEMKIIRVEDKDEFLKENSLLRDKNFADLQSVKNLLETFEKKFSKFEAWSTRDQDMEEMKKKLVKIEENPSWDPHVLIGQQHKVMDEMEKNFKENEERRKEIKKINEELKEMDKKMGEKKINLIRDKEVRASGPSKQWHFRAPQTKVCWRCGKAGHEKKNCSLKIIFCKVHGECGHSTNECHTVWHWICASKPSVHQDHQPFYPTNRPTNQNWRRKKRIQKD